MKPAKEGPAFLGVMLMALGTSFLLWSGAGCLAGSPASIAGSNGRVEAIERPETARLRMVDEQIRARGIRTPEVLAAMETVPRHLFVPSPLLPYAYDDAPLAIGEDQTISQPYIVALMTDRLHVSAGGKVLEIGTGSGYQAAVLSQLGADVYTIEIVALLADAAKKRLTNLGYGRIHFRAGDGYRGWPENAPFDAIIVTAAPDHLPQALVDQLKEGGRLVLPMGGIEQNLWVVTRTEGGVRMEEILPVRFVPMTGEARTRAD